MNKAVKSIILFAVLICGLLVALSCQDNPTKSNIAENITTEKSEPGNTLPAQPLSKEFNDYWYAGKAEITSYKLEQARYGQIREGTAVMVFVTEDFLPEVQVKADGYSKENIKVLKLNATKNFNTGIYPYSIMQSTFFPVSNNQHAIKISASVQEWCGQVYAQLNNREQFEVMSHSYFQSEADENFRLNKTRTENELWTKLRIDPKSLPTGEIEIIPSIEYTRLKHVPIQKYRTIAKLNDGKYSLTYPELKRELSIEFNSEFPHEINGWTESMVSGYDATAKKLSTKATKIKTIKSAYWNKNSNADEGLRTELGLD